MVDEDPFSEEEAERRYLNSKPTCFIIIGKPGSGKTTLAKKLARAWKCEIINGSELINQGIEMQTEFGAKVQEILVRGEAIPEEMCSRVLLDKINSPEVAHHGYVLDGFPSLCEDWLSMADQLDLVKNLPLVPDFIINLKIPDKDLEKRRCEQLVDPLTDTLYTKNEYAPEFPVKDDKDKEDEEEEDEDGEEVEEEMTEEEEEEDEEREELTPELVARLVTRPEDLPQNVAASIKKYRDMMLRTLEDYMADHDQQKLIELDANENPKVVFKSLMMKLNTFKLNHALVPLRLQGSEEGDEISDDTETDDLLRTLAATEMVAPKFRWRRSRWGRMCPVALKEGNVLQGVAQFAVSFLDKLYIMSSNESLANFLRNPRPFLAPHLPRPPCKLCILGPPQSGKTTVANVLAQRYGAVIFDIDELIKSRKEAAKSKMLNEIRDEAIEIAISKISAAKQTILLEAAEEVDDHADEAVAAEDDEAEAKKEEGDEKEDDEEGEGEKDDEERGTQDRKEKEDENEEKISKTSVQAELPIDAKHPEVIKLVEETLAEAEKREVELPPDEYIDVIEEAIQQKHAQLQASNPDGPHAGGWILDNFPRTREQFTAMVERNILADEVICLKDDSENGEFLLKRWYQRNKEELHEKWEARLAEERARLEAERAEQRRRKEEAEKLAAEEARRKEEEERLQREQAEEAGEQGEAESKDEAAETDEAKEGEEAAAAAEEEEEEEEEKEREDEDVSPEPAKKSAESVELQPSGEDVAFAAGDEDDQQSADKDMPPNAPETEDFKNLRSNFDRDFAQLFSVLKGTNNVEPISVSIDKELDALNAEIVKKIEAPFNYRGWEYTGMDQDEEEEDIGEEDEEEEEEEDDLFNNDKKKIYGDTNHYCPVMLKENFVLWPGMAECAAKYRERTYFFSSPEARATFLTGPDNYLAKEKPLQPPPIRLVIIGPKGAGKTLHGRDLAKELGLFHISFKDRLQELIISKTKKKIGPEYEDDNDEELEEQAVSASEGMKGTDEGVSVKAGEGDDSPGQEGVAGETEPEPELTEEEESIRANLADDEPLPNEILDKILPAWWNEEPFRSTGFILEGFPRTDAEARYLASSGLFPDLAVLLAVEDTDIVDRLLPPLLKKWRTKRDKREAEKQRKRALAQKHKEEQRALRREEKLAEIAARKEARMARKAQRDSDDSEEEDEAEEEEEEEDVEALLDAEEEDTEEVEDEEEESEEDAIERLKTEIGDRYDEETGRVATVQETLEEISVPRVEINGGRKPRIVKYCIKKALKPVVEYRESFFDRCFAVDSYLANRMLIMGYKFPSRFGRWCPVKLLEGEVLPPQAAAGMTSYPVVYRQHVYFCCGREERDQFMQCPSRFLKQPSPKPVVPIKMAIIGPPKSGKTTLANRFVEEYGVSRLSIGEAIRKVLSFQSYTELARQINLHLKAGNTVPDELAVQALEVALLEMQSQIRGYILDGYPVTKKQVELMTQRKIIPVRVLELHVDDGEVLRRGTEARHAPSRVLPLHDSQQILGIKLNAWQREVPAVRDWYQKEHRNWVTVDGQRSKWWVWNSALDEARKSVRQIQTYLQRLAEGKAASVSDLCITPGECLIRLGDFAQYCPVSLADRGELVDCSVNASLEFAAEFRGRYYKMASRAELELFLADPARYVPPLAPMKLPPAELLPRRRTTAEVKAMFPRQIELKGYCPVTYLDGKLRYECIVPGEADLVVEYKGKLFCFESEEKLQKFMRLPEKYHGLRLPHKLPPRKEPLLVSGLPMLGYMEQSVATALTKALTAVGCFKPKYPFVDAKKSALLYIAYHLKGKKAINAYNPKSSDYVRKKYKQKLMRFEEECDLIGYLGKEMTQRYREPDELPIDFGHKLTTFLALKDIEPTTTWCV